MTAFAADALPGTWADVLARIAAAGVNEFRFDADGEGLHTRATDPATVAMADVTLRPDGFDAFDAADCYVGVDINALDDAIDLASSDELVSVTFDPETGMFTVDGAGFTYDLAGIDAESVRQEPDVPNLDLDAACDVPAGWLDTAIGGADMVSDHVDITVDPDAERVTIAADGDTDALTFEQGFADIHVGWRPDAPVTSRYSVEYLDEIVDALDTDRSTRIEVGEEFPLRIEQGFADGHGDCTYMVAPRIDSS